MLKQEEKEAVSHSGEDFSSCGSSSRPRCIFKRSASPFRDLKEIFGHNVLVLSARITN